MLEPGNLGAGVVPASATARAVSDVYVISLRRRPKLFENVVRQMQTLQQEPAMRNVPIALHRFDAIDMAAHTSHITSDADKMRSAVAVSERVRAYAQDTGTGGELSTMPITTNALYTMTKYDNMRRYHYQLARLGTIGCYLSHVAVWKRVVDTNKPAIVVEDDHHIVDMRHAAQVLSSIAKAEDTLAQSADVVLITYSNLRNNTDPDDAIGLETGSHRLRFLRVSGEFWGLLMYMVTPRGARLLLRDAFPIEMQVDAYIGMRASAEVTAAAHREQVRVYALDKPMSYENNIYGSSVQSEDNCSLCDLMYDREVGRLIHDVLPEAYSGSGGGPGSTSYQVSNEKIRDLVKRTANSIMSIYNPLRDLSAPSAGLCVPISNVNVQAKTWLIAGIVTLVVGVTLLIVAVVLFARAPAR